MFGSDREAWYFLLAIISDLFFSKKFWIEIVLPIVLSFLLVIALFVGGFFAIAYVTKHTPRNEEKVDIVRLFLVDSSTYKVVIKKGSELKVKTITFCQKGIRLICDVPAGSPMWYEIVDDTGFIHIHDEKDLEGGEGCKQRKIKVIE